MGDRRVAVVTGANRGIGLAIAKGLVERGFRVVGTARDPSSGDEARAAGAEVVSLDVTRPETVEALKLRLSGGLDVLVNNAGASFDGFDADTARRTLDVNLHGVARVTDALLPAMRADGRVVMVSSGMGELSVVSASLRERLADPRLERAGLRALLDGFVEAVAGGRHGAEGWPSNAYSVSKVGLNAVTRILARELAADPRRILVNAACPGWVQTRMGGSGATRTPAEGARTPIWLATLPEGGPTGGFFRDERPIDW